MFRSVDWSHPFLCDSVAGFIEFVIVNWIYLFVCEDMDRNFFVTVERWLI